MEALTYVPANQGSSNNVGYFVAGSQFDGSLYMYDVNLAESGNVTLIGHIPVPQWTRDCSGLNYNADDMLLYAVSDSYEELLIITLDGDIVGAHQLPAGHQEGIAMRKSSKGADEIFIAQDSEPQAVDRYPYPIPSECFHLDAPVHLSAA